MDQAKEKDPLLSSIELENKKTASYLLWSRFLTRSGDQAWDFAVPIVLLQIVPGQLRIAALYYLIVRIGLVLFTPRLTSLIDIKDRKFSVQLGIGLQLLGVMIVAMSIYVFSSALQEAASGLSASTILSFAVLCIGGILGGLGASYSEILVANDIVPATFDGQALTQFNSRLRQVDLFTEVASPIAAGLLLLLTSPQIPFFGFLAVVLWNLISFFPEYLLLCSVLKARPGLSVKGTKAATQKPTMTILEKIGGGWRVFFQSPIALVMLAYALLWLSVLSPHGVLLTAYLKDGLHIPEWQIGTFRGLGAVFGLFATLIFPVAVKKFGLIKASRMFILAQSACVVVALTGLIIGTLGGEMVFLGFILLSRLGLYGFSLGEMQIRQLSIEPSVRGEVNGFASSLTAIATLLLFVGGSLLPSTNQFPVLVWASVFFVLLGAGVFSRWAKGKTSDGDY
jgi:iron-regulated transporter 1